jgi:hypothetical protein
MFSNWLRALGFRAIKGNSRLHNACRIRNRFIPRLEVLETREVPATFAVTNLNDAGMGSLRWAIQQANADPGNQEQITFQGGLSGSIVLQSALPSLSNNISITGAPVTVDGNSQFRIFEVAAGKNCSIQQLNLTNGSSNDGAAIKNYGTLSLQLLNVYDNHSTGSGGGITNISGSQLTISNCHLYLNGCTFDGGGIWNGGTLTIQSNTEIYSNNAGFDGGGISNASGATLTISSSSVYGNSAGFDGGGIMNSGTLNWCSGSLSSNTANLTNGEGGGIYNKAGTATLQQVTITQNSASAGGGFYLVRGTLNLTRCTISGNTATNQGAGGVWLAGTTLTLTNCTVLDPIVQG